MSGLETLRLIISLAVVGTRAMHQLPETDGIFKPNTQVQMGLHLGNHDPESRLYPLYRGPFRTRTIASIYTSPECPFPWRPIIHNPLFGWVGPREFKPKGELAGAEVSRNRQLARWRYHHNTSHVSQKIVMLGSCPSEAARTETRDDGAMISACLRCIRGVRSLVFHKRQGTLI